MENKKIDDIGRVIIPKRIREQLGIKTGDTLRITTKNKKVIFEKEPFSYVCKNCLYVIEEKVNYCSNCGMKLKEETNEEDRRNKEQTESNN